MTNARVNVPATARRGDIIDIKTLVSHVMETGFRRTHLGVPIARDIVTTFIGDAVLAIFPVMDTNVQSACAQALSRPHSPASR